MQRPFANTKTQECKTRCWHQAFGAKGGFSAQRGAFQDFFRVSSTQGLMSKSLRAGTRSLLTRTGGMRPQPGDVRLRLALYQLCRNRPNRAVE